jgi:hypothetical protein
MSTIRRLFAILTIAGLALAPLGRPVMAQLPDAQMQMATELSVEQSDSVAAAMDEMPCCPQKPPVPVGCDACVFMAGCTPSFVGPAPAAVFAPLATAAGRIAPLKDDARLRSLRHPPPEHPPRTLV